MSAVLHRSLRAPPVLAVRGDGCYLIDGEGRAISTPPAVPRYRASAIRIRDVIAAIQRQVGEPALRAHVVLHQRPDRASRREARRRSRRAASAPAASRSSAAARKRWRSRSSSRASTSSSAARRRAQPLHRAAHELSRQHARRAVGRRPLPAPRDVRADADAGDATSRRATRTASGATTKPTRAYGRRVADELDAEILRVGPQRVAAFVAEPVVGATLGCVPAVAGLLRAHPRDLRPHGVLFIADEVMCGMGRTGDDVRDRRTTACARTSSRSARAWAPATCRSARRWRASASCAPLADGLGRARQRPHLHEPRGRVRRRRSRSSTAWSATACSTTCARRARACARRSSERFGDASARRRHPRPRPVPRARAGRGSRQQAAVRARAQDRRIAQGRGARSAASSAIRRAGPPTASAATTCCSRRRTS